MRGVFRLGVDVLVLRLELGLGELRVAAAVVGVSASLLCLLLDEERVATAVMSVSMLLLCLSLNRWTVLAAVVVAMDRSVERLVDDGHI